MKWVGSVGAVLAAAAVGAGAFGAHGLRGRLEPRALENWHTAADYHLLHALALVVVGIALLREPRRALKVSAVALLVGIALFSGSLYALALTDIGPLGAVTPVGGVAFLVGWLALARGLWPPRDVR